MGNKLNHLLIVDDEVILAETLASLLKSSNLNVSVCSSAIQGLELLKEQAFDCVISDFSMPGMNGMDFLKEVKKQNIDSPFIIYTGFKTQELAQEAFENGCFEFIEKPRISGLKDAISRAFEFYSNNENR